MKKQKKHNSAGYDHLIIQVQFQHKPSPIIGHWLTLSAIWTSRSLMHLQVVARSWATAAHVYLDYYKYRV